MDKSSKGFLEKLVKTPSPSGFEQPIQKLWRERVQRYVDETRTDVHGNVIASLNPKGKPRVMIAGHCDEIGLMVNFVSEEGYLSVLAIGGIDGAVLAGRLVNIHTGSGAINGVIGRKPIHLSEPEERKKVPEVHKIWIDIGAKNKKEAAKLVSIGDPITFAETFSNLRNGLVAGRGFDDRVGSFVVAETLKALSKKKFAAALFGVSTVQEEIGLRGAKTSAFGIDPQVGIAVDVTFASDAPGIDKHRVGEVKLGAGPVLCRGANINPVVERLFKEAAEKEKIPYQLVAAPRGTGTDANVIQLTRGGVAAGLVSIPNRYMHTPTEVVSLKDLESTVKLLVAFVCSLKKDTDFTP